MKDYSKIFDHYYGLQYDGNVNDMIKIHELMEQAGIQVSAFTKDKIKAYSDKRPFKVNYFISKVGKTLKWCPTNSPDKLTKMTLKPAEWWIEQLEDAKPVVEVKLPDNWLDEQSKHITDIIMASASKILDDARTHMTDAYTSTLDAVLEEEESVSKYTMGTSHYDDLPF